MGVLENLKDIADLVKKTGEIDLYKKGIGTTERRALPRPDQRQESKATDGSVRPTMEKSDLG
ncbi:MAG: hypothetical protein WB538_05610 [Candidatus Sulfotelmatobacter sp.]